MLDCKFTKIIQQAIKSVNEIWIKSFLVQQLKPSLNIKSLRFIFPKFFKFVNPSSEHVELISCIKLLTITIPFFLQMIGDLKRIEFISTTLKVLIDECIMEN